MKILVIDDSERHLEAARQTLAGHDTTFCSTHDEALELLQPKRSHDKFKELHELYKIQGVEDAFDKAWNEALLPYWDAVLCDLLMPAGSYAQGEKGEKYVGEEMPVGLSLALTAARHGAKYVAVATDMNHHHHPASAMLDMIDEGFCKKPKPFEINSCKVIFTNHVKMKAIGGEETCPNCNGTGCFKCKDKGILPIQGKDWSEVLERLL